MLPPLFRYGDEDDQSTPSVCALTGDRLGRASTTFPDGPFAQLPAAGVAASVGTFGNPSRLGTTSYTSAQNYAIALGLDKATDGFYQPLATDGSGRYVRQGFLHTCGETDMDDVVVPTTEPSRVYAVRVWKRCDAHQHRAVGLQVMQQVEVPTGGLEWHACGAATTDTDAACSKAGSTPAAEFWERWCDHTAPTLAVKVVRVGASTIAVSSRLCVDAFLHFVGPSTRTPRGGYVTMGKRNHVYRGSRCIERAMAGTAGGKAAAADSDHRAIDLPEIEAFGAPFLRAEAPDVAEADPEYEYDAIGNVTALLARHEALTVATISEDCVTAGGGAGNSRAPTPTRGTAQPLVLTCNVASTRAPAASTRETVDDEGSGSGDGGPEDTGTEDKETSGGPGSGESISAGAIVAIVVVMLVLGLAVPPVVLYYRNKDNAAEAGDVAYESSGGDRTFNAVFDEPEDLQVRPAPLRFAPEATHFPFRGIQLQPSVLSPHHYHYHYHHQRRRCCHSQTHSRARARTMCAHTFLAPAHPPSGPCRPSTLSFFYTLCPCRPTPKPTVTFVSSPRPRARKMRQKLIGQRTRTRTRWWPRSCPPRP